MGREGRFTHVERDNGVHWIGGLDDVEKKLFPYRDSNFDPLAVLPVACRYTDCSIPASVGCMRHNKIYELEK
jgi:hypothetical protein